MSGLLPRAHDHREYWQNIVDGVDCTSEVPDSRWNLDDYFDPDPAAPDKTYSRRGAFMPDVDFDPLEFGLPPNQLEVTSTMQTLSLGVARDLLTDAGAEGSQWYDPTRTGVVLGTTGPVPLMHPLAARLSTPVLKEVAAHCGIDPEDAEVLAAKFAAAFAPWEENSFPGLLANVVAGRIANRFGLGGMNCTVDAACAASLAAIRTAIAELVDGRADTMITGGVDTENSIFIYMCFSKVGALSKSDSIKPFSDNADGTLLGEGITMLALRRLDDARRDGNRIYAVIRGIGSSSDGRSKSIYAPRAEGQLVALRRAYADAECSPGSVELFEAHATGTAVGDKTELSALAELLGEDGRDRRYAALGSVKSQIGHTKGAAGTASVMKLALGLHHKVLPGTINVERPNDAISPDGPFYVNSRTRPWVRDPQRPVRRAAASAMGFGGTNFHLVLEEAPGDGDTVRPLHEVARAYIWHAPDVAGLIDKVRTAPPTSEPVPAGAARVGFVAADADGATYLREVAVEQLIANPDAEDWRHPEGIYYRRQALRDLKVAALFAGQGSQYVDMGLSAALNVAPVARAFDTANEPFVDDATRLGSVVFPPPAFTDDERDAQEETLRRTEFAQPAIGALAAGQFRYLRELGLQVADLCGHSFGELTALWASGALSDRDFHALAHARGAAMAPPSPDDSGRPQEAGGMLAVTAGREDVENLIAGRSDVWVCNHNAPDQVVIGGGRQALDECASAASVLNMTVKPLPVSAAFHTSYVGHAVEALRPAVEAVTVGEPAGTVYANSPGATYGADVERNRETLIEQLLRPVEFVSSLRAMADAGCNVFVEFGPKKVLSSLAERTLDGIVAIPTDAGPLGDSEVALKRAAVQLAVLGCEIADIDRYAPEPVAKRKPGAMTVSLSAPEYVPPARRDAYRAELDDEWRVTLPGAELPPTAPLVTTDHRERSDQLVPAAATSETTDTFVNRTERDTPMDNTSARPASASSRRGGLNSLLGEHIDAHRGYLDGQLTLARELAEAVARPGNDPATLAAISAVSDHGVAISEGHIRASEVIAEIVGLDRGVPGGATALTYPTIDVDDEDWSQDVLEPVATVPSSPPTPAAPPAPEPPVAPAAPEMSATDAPVAGVGAEEIRAVLREVVADKTGYPVEMIDPAMDLEADLGVDSIKRVQVLGEVQARFPQLPSLGPEQLGTVRSLDQIVELLALDGGADPKGDAPQDGAVETVDNEDAVDATERHVLGLAELPPIDSLLTPVRAPAVARIVSVGRAGERAAAVAARLRDDRWEVTESVVETRSEHDPDEPGVPAEIAASLREPADLVVLVVDRGDGEAGGYADSFADVAEHLRTAILLAGMACAGLVRRTADSGRRASFVTMTAVDGRLGTNCPDGAVGAAVAGIGGLVKTAAAEHPELFVRALDVDPELPGEVCAELLLAELSDSACDVLEVGISAERRRVSLVPSRWRDSALRTAISADPVVTQLGSDDVVLVSGGARGITAQCVEALATRTDARFVLMGRTPVEAEPEWAVDTADSDLRTAAIAALAGTGASPAQIDRTWRRVSAGRAISALLERLNGSRSSDDRPRARYLVADVSDPRAVREALAPLRSEITAVVHGAGVLADAPLVTKTSNQIRSVLAPKLQGLGAVLDSLEPAPEDAGDTASTAEGAGDTASASCRLRSLVLFTSVAGLYGNAGQADYATANEALVRFAWSWKVRRPECHVTAIDWGAWDGGMVDEALRQRFLEAGVSLLAPHVGARAFVEQYTADRGDDVAVLIGTARPLGRREAPSRSVAVQRHLDDVLGHPLVNAHRIGEHPVLPATAAIGAMVNVAERALVGREVRRVENFDVLRGLVFGAENTTGGAGADTGVRIEVAPAGDGDAMTATIATTASDGRHHPRYRCRLSTTHSPVVLPSYPTLVGAGDPAIDLYRNGIQFHAPPLQGMRRFWWTGEDSLAVECELPQPMDGIGGFHGDRFDPVLADFVLQVPPVVGHRLLGAACLPLRVGEWKFHRPLPADEPFLVVAHNARPDGGQALIDVAVHAADRTALMYLRDVVVVTTGDLSEKFSDSVRRWNR
ncbi:polyketide synthase [Nocardia farcinica]|nr:polyketide synthase [Nocardia farcinica]